MSVHSTCGFTNIYGPFNKQYTFLGCSIESVSASAGWNEQNSELTVQLVEDCASVNPGDNPKVYYNELLQEVEFTGPDPGFSKPHPGVPAYFRLADFEFSGIIQGWTENNSEGGKPRYTVRLVDPREILNGTQLIIGDYSGGVGSIYNLINVFGFIETFGNCAPSTFENSCSDTFGSALGFGGSLANESGMPWNRILTGTRLLTSSLPPQQNIWSPYGRLIFKGPNSSGYGLMPADYFDLNLYTQFSNGIVDINLAYHDGNICFYLLDLDELPTAPDYFRISGTNISVLDVISQVCDIAGYDYYIELIPVVSGGQIYKFIKVRTINRNNQPALDVLNGYVTDKNVSESNIGQELRNETTSVFISGGLKETVHQVYQSLDPSNDPSIGCLPVGEEADDMIQPFMGFDTLGNVIIGTKDDEDFWEWEFDVSLLRTKLKGDIGIQTSIIVNEEEILAARTGFDSWQLWAYAFNTELKQLVDPSEEMLGRININNITGMGADNFEHMRAADFINFTPGRAEPREVELAYNLEKAYEWISSIANENYGKRFMIRVPSTCIKIDTETGIITTSEEPIDSAWTDSSTILGITNPSNFLNFVSTEEGKILPFVMYSDASLYDVDDLQDTDYGIFNNTLYLKASVEPGYVYTNISTLCSPRVVINIDAVPNYKEPTGLWADNQVGAVMKALNKLVAGGVPDEVLKTMQNNSHNLLLLGISQKMGLPDAVAIPFRSNINRYGPWVTAGPPGQVRFEINDDLVPWNYGGSSTLCLAGQALADEGVTFQQAVESGSITLPGYPVYRVGSEFNAPSNPADLVENRTLTTSSFSETQAGASSPTEIDYVSAVMGSSWNGVYGPNISDVQVNIGPQGVLTIYSFRTYVQKAGRLAKVNAERLKQIGKFAYLGRKRNNTIAILKGLIKKRRKKGS